MFSGFASSWLEQLILNAFLLSYKSHPEQSRLSYVCMLICMSPTQVLWCHQRWEWSNFAYFIAFKNTLYLVKVKQFKQNPHNDTCLSFLIMTVFYLSFCLLFPYIPSVLTLISSSFNPLLPAVSLKWDLVLLIEINNLSHVIFFSPLVLLLWLLHFELKTNKQFLKGNVLCMPLGVFNIKAKIESAFTFIKKKRTECYNQKLDLHHLPYCFFTFSFHFFYFWNWEKELNLKIVRSNLHVALLFTRFTLPWALSSIMSGAPYPYSQLCGRWVDRWRWPWVTCHWAPTALQ